MTPTHVEKEWTIGKYSFIVWCNTEKYNKEYFTVEVTEQNKSYFLCFKNGNPARYKNHTGFTVAILDFLHIEGTL